MRSSRLVRYGAISFLIGVSAGSLVLDAGWITRVAFAAVILCSVLSAGLLSDRYRLLCVVVIAAGVGFSYVSMYYEWQKRGSSSEAPTTFSADIQFVEPLVDIQRLIVVIREPANLQQNRAYVYTDRYPLYAVGMRAAFTCTLKKPEPFDDFAFDRFAAMKNIQLLCRNPEIVVQGISQPVVHALFMLKEWYSRQYDRAFHEPENALLQAMVLNRAGEFPPAVRTQFSASGISHVISISGMHISLIIIAGEIFLIALGLGRGTRLALLSVSMGAYLVLLGFPPPAVRSVLMALCLLLARLTGRPVDGTYILILVATVMALQDPLVVMYDIGFQLSFAALFGIMQTTDFWTTALSFIPERFGLRAVSAMTLAAQTFTWPLTAYYFKMISLIAPLTNIVVIVFLAPILIFAFLMPLGAYVFFMQPLLVWPLFFSLKILVFAAAWASRVPYAALSLGSFSRSWMLASFVAMGLISLTIKKIYEAHSTP